jgi:YaiO family outer membrane protein
MKTYWLCALVAFSSTSYAATPLPDLKKITASVDGEYLSYSGPFGSRRIVNGSTLVEMPNTKLLFGIAQGTRKAGGAKFDSTRASISVAHDWSSRISTRTYASIANDKPVFVTREIGQDISYKPLSQTVLTVGARYARYFGGVDTRSWSAGAAQYFHGGMVSYRFSSFNIQHIGHTYGHLLNLRLSDPYGSTQLWAGHGSALHDAVWLATPEKGKYTNLELRRVQPLAGGVGLSFGGNRIWYETGNTKHHGTGFKIGLTFSK